MSNLTNSKARLVDQLVTYALLKDDKFYIIENVPACVNVETGEQLFTPETVEQLQQIVWEQQQPKWLLQAPVYEFAQA
jgi:hypothetical protein